MDIKKTDFPIFNTSLKDKAYLDNAATTQKPKSVIKAISNYYETSNANVHRGAYALAESASSDFEEAREKVARFINAKPNEIIFTSGTTEGINLVANTLSSDDEVVITQVEHHANLLPWQRVAKVKYITLNPDYTLNWDGVITSKTKLVAISTYSNVLGPLWGEGELEKLIQKSREVGALVLLDIAQDIPAGNVDIKALGADFAVFSGHKMMGPTGIGVLYIREGVKLEPYQLGGSMVYSAGYETSEWKKAPHKFEAGTPNIAGAIGLGAAIDYLEDLSGIKEHQAKLCRRFIDGLKGVKVLGNIKRLKSEGHLVSFVVDGVHAHDIAAYLDKKGIFVRAGHHCAQPLHNLLGVRASVRVSFYVYNTEADVDRLLQALDEAINYFR